jgi:predicted RNase H-like HicB family nuclease
MKYQFTAIIKKTDKWYIGFCPEVPGANGQGKTRQACLEDLAAAVELMLEVNREQTLRQAGRGVEETTLLVG